MKEADNAAHNNIPIVALGVGSDWNEDLLMEIGFKSGGQADYIDQALYIGQYFEATAKAMRSAVVQNAMLTLHLVAGVTPLGYSPISDRAITIPLGELEKDRGQALLVELMLPAWQAGTYRIAQAEVVYDVPQLNLSQESVQADIMLRFTHDPNLARLVNSRVIDIVEKVVALKV